MFGFDVHHQALPHVLLEASELFTGLVEHRTNCWCLRVEVEANVQSVRAVQDMDICS